MTGCPDPEVNPGVTWFDRTDEGLVSIGCSNGHARWLLRCVNNAWTGLMGNCSTGERDHRRTTGDSLTKLRLRVVVVVVVVIVTHRRNAEASDTSSTTIDLT